MSFLSKMTGKKGAGKKLDFSKVKKAPPQLAKGVSALVGRLKSGGGLAGAGKWGAFGRGRKRPKIQMIGRSLPSGYDKNIKGNPKGKLAALASKLLKRRGR
jgi:hypothetical protein